MIQRIFLSQAYRELGAARLFENALPFAPDVRAHAELKRQATEERAHLEAVMGLWGDLQPGPLMPLVEERLRARPLPAVGSWLDVVLARLLYDRAGLWQLREYVDCSHGPYAALARRIVADEERHVDAGGLDARAQPRFEHWLRAALLSFGRPGSAASQRAIELGLKRRDPAEVIRDFVDDVRPYVREAGLSFPPAARLGLELPPGCP